MLQKKTSSVYLLVSKNKPMFKIGKADDVISRMTTLERHWDEFDYTRSIEVVCIDQVFDFERSLQKIFKNYNLKPSELGIDEQAAVKADGYTEFFHIDCFDGVKENIEHLKKWNSNVLEVKNGESFLESYNTRVEENRLLKEEKEKSKKENSFVSAGKQGSGAILKRKIGKIKRDSEKLLNTLEYFREHIIYFNSKVSPLNGWGGILVFDSSVCPPKNSTRYDGDNNPVHKLMVGDISLFTMGRGTTHLFIDWDRYVEAHLNAIGDVGHLSGLSSFFKDLEEDRLVIDDHNYGAVSLYDAFGIPGKLSYKGRDILIDSSSYGAEGVSLSEIILDEENKRIKYLREERIKSGLDEQESLQHKHPSF